MFKEIFANKKLIIFDLDGTVIQSQRVWDLAYKKVAEVAGFGTIDTSVSSGDTLANDWKHILATNVITNSRPVNELVELTQNEYIQNLDKLEVTEGFWPFVAELKLMKKLNLGLVSNSCRVVVDRVIAHLELKEVFDFVLCGDEVKHPKPDPEIYKKALARFKIPSKEVLVFEDSLTGCISAAKAGLKIICVWDGETPQRKFPDEVLEYTKDFTPFPGEMDTTYYEDIVQMAKEQEQEQKTTAKV